MILILEVAFASIAAILSVLSLKTLKAIKHLGVGKSFWIPMFLSGIFFLTASVVIIFNEMNFSLTTKTDEIVQTSRLIALCILLGGIYSYSRKVIKNLAGTITVPEKVAQENLKMEAPIAPALPPIQERIIQEEPKTETAHECKHQLGYLRTLPKNASIPDECMTCNRIVECKHSLLNTLESRASARP